MKLRIGQGPAGKGLATLAALFILTVAATLAAAVTPGMPFPPAVLGLPVDDPPDGLTELPRAVRLLFVLLALALAAGALAGLLKTYRYGVFPAANSRRSPARSRPAVPALPPTAMRHRMPRRPCGAWHVRSPRDAAVDSIFRVTLPQ